MITHGTPGRSAREIYHARARQHVADSEGFQMPRRPDPAPSTGRSLDLQAIARRAALWWPLYLAGAIAVSVMFGDGGPVQRFFYGVMHTVSVGTIVVLAVAWWVEAKRSREISEQLGYHRSMTSEPQVLTQPKDLPFEVERWLIGAQAEERTADILSVLGDEWECWHDISVASANIDHLLIGPPGIVVIDTKAWGGSVTVKNGQLHRPDHDISGVVGTIEYEAGQLLNQVGEEKDFPFWNAVDAKVTIIVAVHGARAGMPAEQLASRYPAYVVEASGLAGFLSSMSPTTSHTGLVELRRFLG